MFEQSLASQPTFLNKSLASHPKFLNKSLILHPKFCEQKSCFASNMFEQKPCSIYRSIYCLASYCLASTLVSFDIPNIWCVLTRYVSNDVHKYRSYTQASYCSYGFRCMYIEFIDNRYVFWRGKGGWTHFLVKHHCHEVGKKFIWMCNWSFPN